jgi:hypothetical protein
MVGGGVVGGKPACWRGCRAGPLAGWTWTGRGAELGRIVFGSERPPWAGAGMAPRVPVVRLLLDAKGRVCERRAAFGVVRTSRQEAGALSAGRRPAPPRGRPPCGGCRANPELVVRAARGGGSGRQGGSKPVGG